MRLLKVTAGLLLLLTSSAMAAETITYTYDALGRVCKSSHSGTVNNGLQTTYKHDPVGNRKNTTTTGAAP
jgi:hypothetical protein